MRAPTGLAMSVICPLATTTYGASNYMSGNSVLRADDVLNRPFSDILRVDPASLATGRRAVVVNAALGQESPQLNNDGSLNLTAWNAVTDTACIKALVPLSRSSNPSGNCICYNLPSLDTASGVFEAELRLYRISEARDSFTNITPENIRVALKYHGASVSPVSVDELMGMGKVENQTQMVAPRAVADAPRLVQTYYFVGQIDQAKMAENMSMAAFEAVLIPTLSLTGTNANGSTVSTNVSMNEASFLTGIFSQSLVMSDFSAAQAAVTAKLDLLHNGTVAFILPGTQIMVFPIGAIITSVWLFLGLVAYGWGTFERMNYADSYKRRMVGGSGSRTL